MVDQDPNIAAVVPSAKARIEIQTRSIPTPAPNQVIVRNRAIGINPVEHMIQDYTFFVTNYPNVLGSDSCGIVHAIGSKVTNVKVGDRVLGFASVIYTQNPDEGSLQTYTVLKDIAIAKLPDSISFEEGATLPMNVCTAGAALYMGLGLPLPESATPSPDYKGQGVVVYGASTAIGTAFVQMASQLGMTIFAIASSSHETYIKSLGANHFFDRNQVNYEANLVKTAKQSSIPLSYAFDCISQGTSFLTVANILSQGKGDPSNTAKIANVMPWPQETPLPPGVESVAIQANACFRQQPEIGKWLFNDYLTTQLKLKSNAFKPSPPFEIVPGGIKATQHAWDTHKKGVSAKKLILVVE